MMDPERVRLDWSSGGLHPPERDLGRLGVGGHQWQPVPKGSALGDLIVGLVVAVETGEELGRVL